MTDKGRTVLLHHGLAVLFAGLAVVVRWLLDPWLDEHLPFATLYGPVALMVWLGGYRPAVLTAALGFVACNLLFLSPRGEFSLHGPRHVIALAGYLVSCSLIIGLGEAMRSALAKRQLAEGALRQSEATLRAIYDNSPLCMGVTEPTGDGDVLHHYDNPATCRFFGAEPGATAGKRALADLGGEPAVVARWLAQYERSLATGRPAHFEHEYRTPSGTRWLSATVCPIGPGPTGRPRFCYVAEDVTERKRAEAALRRQATIFENQTDGIIITDLAGHILDWNPACERMLGYGKAEVLGRTTAMFHRPEESETLTREALAAMERDGVWRGEITFVRKDGSLGTCETVVRPLVDEAGRVVGGVGVNRDVTDRKRAEAEARRLAALVEGTSDFVAIAGPDGQLTYVNQAGRRLVGIPPGADPCLYAHRSLCPEWAFERTQKEWLPAALRDGSAAGEGALLTLDGREVPVSFVLLAHRGPGGQLEATSTIARDITERKRVEERLRRNHDTFYHLIQNNPFGVFIVDADFRLAQASAGSRKVFRNVSPLLGRDFAEVLRSIWLEPFASEAIARFRHALATGEPYYAPSTVERRADNAEVEAYDWRVERVALPDGRYGVVCYFYDLTERQRLEAALRESEGLFRALGEAMPDLLWMADAAGAPLYQNPAWRRYVGMGQQELAALGWEAAHHPDDRPTLRGVWRRALAGGEAFEMDLRLRRHDGEYRWFSARTAPLKDDAGRVVKWVGTMTDVHGRRRDEERLRLLWEAASALLTAAEPAPPLQELFERIGPHVGADVYFHFLLDGAGEALVLESWRGVTEEAARSLARLKVGEGPCGLVAARRAPVVLTHVQRSEGEEACLAKALGLRAFAGNPLMAGGRLLGTLSFASRDRDRFDDDELEFLQTVSHHVTAAYDRAGLVRQLREADRRKDEFLATLAHELRNPLAPIRNAVQVLRLKGGGGEEAEWARGLIERQVGHMARLLDDLLDVSRITRDKLQLRRSRATLAAVVESALETSRPLIEAEGHGLSVSLPEAPVWLDADVVRLAQVFSNLLNNAAKYTERGGEIALEAVVAGGEVVVSVKDSGIGISADVLPRLFEIFTQARPALERAQGGLGIGLALVKGLVQMHGGAVEARSDGPGRGSEFVVRLPLAGDEGGGAGEERACSPAPAPSADRRRVLVADDNRDAADSLVLLLTAMGHEARTAYDGQEAVDLGEAFRPEVVLLDIGMPRLNGYEAARQIRRRPWGAGALLVALTGWGQEEDRRKSREAGFDHHLIKPVEPAALGPLLARRGT